MNKGFGGSQPFMHSSSVSSCDLGEFDNWPMTLKLGDTQHFQFPEAPESASIGPWWFATDEEREKNMHDIELDEWKNPRLNKSELFLTMSWTLIKQKNLIKLWEHYFLQSIMSSVCFRTWFPPVQYPSWLIPGFKFLCCIFKQYGFKLATRLQFSMSENQ